MVKIFFLVLWIIAACGWVANIVKLGGLVFNHSVEYGIMLFRTVGIFVAPLGAILGYV